MLVFAYLLDHAQHRKVYSSLLDDGSEERYGGFLLDGAHEFETVVVEFNVVDSSTRLEGRCVCVDDFFNEVVIGE